MPAFTRESLRKRDFSRRRKCKEAGGCFSAKKNGAKRTLLRRGGEDEIRTHGCVNITAFPMLRLRPLGHLSKQPAFL